MTSHCLQIDVYVKTTRGKDAIFCLENHGWKGGRLIFVAKQLQKKSAQLSLALTATTPARNKCSCGVHVQSTAARNKSNHNSWVATVGNKRPTAHTLWFKDEAAATVMMTMMMTTMMMTMMMIDDDALKAASIEEEDPINKEKLEEVDAAMAEQLEKDTKYKKLHADVVAQKLKLVSQKVAVQNGKVHPLFLE